MENSTQSKKLMFLLVVAVLLGGLTLLLNTLPQRKITQQKATSDKPVTVLLSPATKQVAVGETFEVQVGIKSEIQVTTSTVGTAISFDPAQVTISEVKCLAPYGSPSNVVVENTRLLINCFIPAPGEQILQVNQLYPFGSFKVTIKPGVTGPIAFGLNQALTMVPNITLDDFPDLTGTVAGASYTIGGGQAQYPVTLTLDPADGSTIKKGETTTVSVKISSNPTSVIYAGGLDITYDPNVMTISDVICNTPALSQARGEAVGTKIYLSCFVPVGTSPISLGATPVVLGTFKVALKDAAVVGQRSTMTVTRAEITPEDGKTNLVNAGGVTNYTIGAAGVSGSVVLAFSIRSQGINDVQRADQKVSIRVKKAGFDKNFANVNLVSDRVGVYSGQATLDGVAPGAGYSIFVKGPKHLAKKMCENNQTKDKRCGEVGTLTLVAGTNTFNWSAVYMEGGDLPLVTGGQNGVVNSLDYTFINEKLGSSAVADLAVGDINLDGVINATDRVLLRNTMETKYEEDY